MVSTMRGMLQRGRSFQKGRVGICPVPVQEELRMCELHSSWYAARPPVADALDSACFGPAQLSGQLCRAAMRGYKLCVSHAPILHYLFTS